jgi:hypothetical protein
MNATKTKITLNIDSEIQGEEREQLWSACCGSYPVMQMTDDSEVDSSIWIVERNDGTNEEQYLSERETLRDCIYNLGYLIEGYGSGEWSIR